ncbi:MAG: HAD family hydrolase [Pirellulales bacterium]|nr:HAD family hydrolase [Pirellulales bacterium]
MMIIKPLLILDLDETLVFSDEAPLDRPCDFQVGPFFVYKRPHLDEFLTAVASEYQLAVWSSATSDYVTAVVDKLLPSNVELEFVWARKRCVRRMDFDRQEQVWLKDLRKVKKQGYDLERTLIVDDEPLKLVRNYGNAIYIKPFVGDPLDAELPLLLNYLHWLQNQPHFRKIEKRGWRRVKSM